MVTFARIPFWVSIFDPQPILVSGFGHMVKLAEYIEGGPVGQLLTPETCWLASARRRGRRCQTKGKRKCLTRSYMAVGQHQWYHVGVGAPPSLEPILVGTGMFTGGTGF